MITTIFVDVNNASKVIKSFSYHVPCQKGDYVDFEKYDSYSDHDIYVVKDVIFLPNDAQKIVELEQTHR